MVTSITFSIRVCRPGERARLALEAALPFAHGGDKQRRPSNGPGAPTAPCRAPPATGPTRTPARSGPSPCGCACRAGTCRSRSPRPRPRRAAGRVMTHLTSQCACQNSANSDRSEEVSGSAACATSAGFIASVPSEPIAGRDRADRGRPHFDHENRDGAPLGPNGRQRDIATRPAGEPNFARASRRPPPPKARKSRQT